MTTLAFVSLVLAMLTALAGAAWACVQLWSVPAARQGQSALASALKMVERANDLVTLCLILASLILLRALIAGDFSLVYVVGYTDRVLPLFYRITAFWAGQAGSLLFWAFSVALCGSLFQYSTAYRSLSPATRLWYWVFSLSIMGFFGLLLITWNNPFLSYPAALPDGNGLNPLLQNPGMIFHPPLLFLGYGGFVIPGCLALAQTLSRAGDAEAPWARVARPFTLSAWAFLTAGIVLGGWWAYMELGWGGYWAWDPVENASLIPWLVGTAALHTLIIQERRDKLHGINVFLMALTTISAFFATYLVRSGVVQSVHAFGEGGVGTPLLLFILSFMVLAFWIARQAAKPGSGDLGSLTSREGFLVLTSWILLALSVIILLGTLWPVISVFWQETVMGMTIDPTSRLDAAGHDHGGAVGLTADFYNRVCLPLFALLTALLAICPWLGWDGTLRKRTQLAIAIGVFVGGCVALWLLNYRVPVAVFGAGAAMAALVSALLMQLRNNMGLARRCAWGLHLGVALMVLGVAFSGPFKIEADPQLAVGEKVMVGDFEVVLKNLYTGRGQGYDFLEAELEVYSGGQLIGVAAPQRRIYPKWGQMQFAEAATIPSLGHEFYATLMAVDAQNRVLLKLSSTPLVNWLWIGGTLMCLLPFFMLRRNSRKTPSGQMTDHKAAA